MLPGRPCIFPVTSKETTVKHSKRAIEPRTYSLAETADILGFGRTTLQDHVRNGSANHLHPISLGTRTRFPKAVIDALAEGAA
ncbi:helix-turn-helix domain-containing protein [Corynebacterium sp. zg910]|nr:helix-turn-helix domain-containing protein [Corynebacterium lujinxingii]NNO09644.1 helix-turn-helix domain-containing protein [Corynebacterium lujinxingii]